MSVIEIEKKAEELKTLEALIEEAKAQAETLRDAIKAEMTRREAEELEAGRFIIRWSTVLSNRFDTTAFKRDFPQEYKDYTKQTTSRRFTIA